MICFTKIKSAQEDFYYFSKDIITFFLFCILKSFLFLESKHHSWPINQIFLFIKPI